MLEENSKLRRLRIRLERSNESVGEGHVRQEAGWMVCDVVVSGPEGEKTLTFQPDSSNRLDRIDRTGHVSGRLRDAALFAAKKALGIL